MKEFIRRYGKYLNKRVLTAVGLCLLLIAAVVTNILVNRTRNTEAKETGAQTNSGITQVSSQSGPADANFFASYREERDNVRTQELAYLDAIVAQGADSETLADAQQQKLELVNAMETELTVENLVRAKGFTDVIVSIHKGNINVVVGTDTLNDEQVAQILDIVLRETGKSAENVKISTTL
ncbi:MAG: SpoIIIAH-like family protein [Clostridia bacterium]|nr:SpoIIIAH-like family protein [Clostridia bacterium]